MPRLSPVTGKADVPADQHAVVDQVVKVFGGVRGPFSMLLHSPKLAERVLGLVTFFRDESVTEPMLRSVQETSGQWTEFETAVWENHKIKEYRAKGFELENEATPVNKDTFDRLKRFFQGC